MKKEDNFLFSIDTSKKKNYTLEMLYYPSGKLHVGHLRLFTIGDAVARANRLKGFNVLHPMGADAFGLPAENAAIQNGTHPKTWTYQNIKTMNDEIKKVEISYDWSKTLNTCDPEYIAHEQKIFIDFFNKGLAYKKESLINWDPIDKTVLSNEQVINGKGWRSGVIVEKKNMSQWFFKITHYAEELLQDLRNLDWTEKIKKMQEKWIGKSEGAEIDFEIINNENSPQFNSYIGQKISVFTTRPETIYGVTSIAISFDHSIAIELEKNDFEISSFLKECRLGGIAEEEIATRKKKGIYTKLFAKNPISNEIIPILITNYVLMNYGTGAVMMVPAHDERDFECIKECFCSLEVKYVIHQLDPNILDNLITKEKYHFNDEFVPLAFSGHGTLKNSILINELHSKNDKEKILEILSNNSKNIRKKTTYKLRDWCVSRQRYWGCPIPIIYCDSCGILHEKKENLPILLPNDVVFDGHGNPLENHATWKNCKCPKCGKNAVRETDTLDTYVESSWYFLRYINPQLQEKPFDLQEIQYTMPVDLYLGGPEHATTHMLYARFFMKAIRDCGYFTDFQGDKTCEPFKRFIATGMVCHKTYQTEDGKYLYPSEVEEIDGKYFEKNTKQEVLIGPAIKMSKSKKNTVEPSEVIEKYGVDVVRFFMLSDNPIDNDFDWNSNGLKATYEYIEKISSFFNNLNNKNFTIESDIKIKNNLNKLLNLYIDNFDSMKFNISNAKFREVITILLQNYQYLSKEDFLKIVFKLIMLISPVMPNFTSKLINEFKLQKEDFKWEKNQVSLNEESLNFVVQINGKTKKVIEVLRNLDEIDVVNIVNKIEFLKNNFEKSPVKKVIFIKDKLINFII